MKNFDNICNQNKLILVCSDLHGMSSPVLDMIDKHKPDCVFYLGDGIERVTEALSYCSSLPLYSVMGNCDGFSFDAPVKEITLFGVKILYCHGHTFKVKQSLDLYKAYAKAQSADIALFGHTHKAYYEVFDNIHFLNPGSPTRPQDSFGSYALIEISPDKKIKITHHRTGDL